MLRLRFERINFTRDFLTVTRPKLCDEYAAIPRPVRGDRDIGLKINLDYHSNGSITGRVRQLDTASKRCD